LRPREAIVARKLNQSGRYPGDGVWQTDLLIAIRAHANGTQEFTVGNSFVVHSRL